MRHTLIAFGLSLAARCAHGYFPPQHPYPEDLFEAQMFHTFDNDLGNFTVQQCSQDGHLDLGAPSACTNPGSSGSHSFDPDHSFAGTSLKLQDGREAVINLTAHEAQYAGYISMRAAMDSTRALGSVVTLRRGDEVCCELDLMHLQAIQTNEKVAGDYWVSNSHWSHLIRKDVPLVRNEFVNIEFKTGWKADSVNNNFSPMTLVTVNGQAVGQHRLEITDECITKGFDTLTLSSGMYWDDLAVLSGNYLTSNLYSDSLEASHSSMTNSNGGVTPGDGLFNTINQTTIRKGGEMIEMNMWGTNAAIQDGRAYTQEEYDAFRQTVIDIVKGNLTNGWNARRSKVLPISSHWTALFTNNFRAMVYSGASGGMSFHFQADPDYCVYEDELVKFEFTPDMFLNGTLPYYADAYVQFVIPGDKACPQAPAVPTGSPGITSGPTPAVPTGSPGIPAGSTPEGDADLDAGIVILVVAGSVCLCGAVLFLLNRRAAQANLQPTDTDVLAEEQYSSLA